MPGSVHDMLVQSDEAAYYSWMLAALSPWATVPDSRSGCKGGRPLLPFPALVVQEGLKGSTKLRSLVAAAYHNRQEIVTTVQMVNTSHVGSVERDKVGMAIRRWDHQGGHWRLQVLNALMVEAFCQLTSNPSLEGRNSTPEKL
jgi:tRNA nucleotidyltransferase (CCA-adding enzyme)